MFKFNVFDLNFHKNQIRTIISVSQLNIKYCNFNFFRNVMYYMTMYIVNNCKQVNIIHCVNATYQKHTIYSTQ